VANPDPIPDPVDLEELLNSCRRNGRPALFPTKQPKIYFDADRFRWWLRHGIKQPKLMAEFTERAGAERLMPLDKWREWIDKHIRTWEASNASSS
jgi:hypothetical protein